MFQKQAIMRKVLYSLVPILLWSLYLYGWRVLALGGVVFGVGILSEFLMEKPRNKKVSEAVLVTSALLTLSLPPAVPLWIAAIASVFGVVMAKEVFGGFGRNIFNPAIAGRLFTYISFPLLMQTTWMLPGNFGFLGLNNRSQGSTPVEALFMLVIIGVAYLIITRNYGNKKLVGGTIGGAIALIIGGYLLTAFTIGYAPEVDVVTTVTPLELYRGATGEGLPPSMAYLKDNTLANLFLGRRSGSIGESSILLILLGAIYMVYTKTANWRMMVSTLVSAAALSAALYYTGNMPRLAPEFAAQGKTLFESLEFLLKFMFSGSLIFVAVYMSTDPVSAPNKPLAQLLYGTIIGTVTVLVRVYSGFPEGTSFGILMANTFASYLDELVPAPKKKAKKV